MKRSEFCLVGCENISRELLALDQFEGFEDVVTSTYPSKCGMHQLSWEDFRETLRGHENCRFVDVLGGCCVGHLTQPPEALAHLQIHRFGHDINLFADSSFINSQTQRGAYLMTPGWLERWQHWMTYQGFEQNTATEFYHETTKRLVLLDTGVISDISTHLQAFADFVDLPYEVFPVGLGYFRLLASNIILQRRLENEKQVGSKKLSKARIRISDYAMTMDLLKSLVETTREEDAISRIIELFVMLSAAETTEYISYNDEAPDVIFGGCTTVETDNTALWKLLQAFQEDYIWLPSGKGFLLRISRQKRTLGVLLIDNLKFPEYKDHYLNLGLSISKICGLAIENARSIQRIVQSEQDLKLANERLSLQHLQLEQHAKELQSLFEKMAISEEQFRGAFVSASHGMVLASSKGEFTRVNQAFCSILGYKEEELLGKSFRSITHSEDLESDLENIRRLLAGEAPSFQMEKRYIHKSGATIWADLSVSIVRDKHNKPLHVVGQVIDITERIQAQNDMLSAIQAAERANKSKSEFLANMSHEIRTPLNAVIGFSDLLSLQISDETQKGHLNSIKIAGKSLLTLINDILNLSRIESGIIEMQYSAVDLGDVLGEIKQVFSVKAGEKGIDIQTDFEERLPAVLVLDETRLRQILLNLVGNAIKFTHGGYVKLSAKAGLVDETRNTLDLILSVEDTGIGIPAEEYESIFEPFKQQTGQDNSRYGGTGLGLSISKRLTEMMNGKITLSSEVGRGSRFEIVLPGVKIASLESRRDKDPLSVFNSYRFDPATVLVIDDVKSNRRLMREILQNSGIEVLEAENGKTGYSLAEKTLPNLIFMDLWMPVMDGFQTLKKIKENPKLVEIPVLGITASGDSQAIEDMQKAGFDNYLLKPFKLSSLFELVSDYLSGKPVDHNSLPSSSPMDINDSQFDAEDALCPEVIQSLREILVPMATQVQQVFIIKSVADLAEAFIAEGNTYQNQMLQTYGYNLQSFIKSFDVANIKELLKEFLSVAEELILQNP